MANSSSLLSDGVCDVITKPSTSSNNINIINSNNTNTNNNKTNIIINNNNKNNNKQNNHNNKNMKQNNINNYDDDDEIIQENNIKTVEYCNDPDSCLSLSDILKSFNAPISEEQAWALIYQSIRMYNLICQQKTVEMKDVRIPLGTNNLNIHKDGSIHITVAKSDRTKCIATSQKKILLKLGLVVYHALDYNLPSDEECIISSELEQVINYMTLEDADDEGIERDSEDVEDEKFVDTKELDHVLELCKPRVSSSVPEDHYKAVCRALATESLDLRVFLQKVFQGDAESLRLKAHAETSQLELSKLCFSDWARFWMQVVDELRRGVRLKKSNCSRTPVEFELTPYEILMEDIRTRKYNLRKVMINGDIPQRVKKDAHAVILEFIRSRPPLRKASERKLQPLKRNPSPREQLLDSIRKGRILKPVPKLKSRLLPTSQLDSLRKTSELHEGNLSPRRQQRLIPVDFSLFQDDENTLFNSPMMGITSTSAANLPPQSSSTSSTIQCNNTTNHTKLNNENNQNNINTILRRTRNTITQDEYHRFCDTALESYDLATQCESRRASMRRHTIVGCQSSTECQSMPPSRPESRQSELSSNTLTTINPIATLTTTATNISGQTTDTWTKNSLDEKQWKETMNVNDRLSLTLEEIVHIRSVMTKAELEGLPVGVRVKEDVERKKVCFLCLRTRFSIFGQWGVQCKLCHRTVCNKCYTKMRIPTEHFRNVPVVLLSPSLMNSPVTSQTPSPSHHAHHSGGPSSLVDENFPRSLMERLMRPELERKTRNTVGSAPSSPKHQRSASSTPSCLHPEQTQHLSLSIAGSTNGVLGAKNNNNNINNNNNNNSNSNNSSNCNSIMSRSMEGPRSLPPQSPARPHSNNSTLDRRNRFAKAFSTHTDQKELLRGEMMAVCNDCRGLVLEIIRSSRQTRSTARNQAIRNLTLDLSPVYKRCKKQQKRIKKILIIEKIFYSIELIPIYYDDDEIDESDVDDTDDDSNLLFTSNNNSNNQIIERKRKTISYICLATSATCLLMFVGKKIFMNS